MIPEFVVLLDGHDIFGGAYAMFLQPFGVYIRTSGRLVHDLEVRLLTVFRYSQLTKTRAATISLSFFAA